ncbi:Polysaccharide pyruvyl transferase [Pirellulimonas nuda]|uniref:Polysaccharide pyruvyl transferase n=1 Tax=Pirellulimonas nuda TaxID=2528009 RepID=A0A518DD03_9BACT|nr:hypothetical protein [Pirellulimonas nuda]QDU89365.1 Polysaccharide pyruvyl transferase [Pirellulimonas nuda]
MEPNRLSGWIRNFSSWDRLKRNPSLRRLSEPLLRRTELPEDRSLLCVYRVDPSNLGDWFSAPQRYFGFLTHSRKQDIRSLTRRDLKRIESTNGTIVIGGGGLLGRTAFSGQIDKIMQLKAGKVVVWGAGFNDRSLHQDQSPRFRSERLLVGLRDDQAEYGWVPCASCMLPDLSLEYPVQHEVVVYHHAWHTKEGRLKQLSRFPSMSNNSTPVLSEILRFLGSGETVVTNSYHGAYWAILMGRRAVVFDPFSVKFRKFRHEPAFLDDDLDCSLKSARVYPDALEECRRANLNFAQQVLAFINA